MATTYSRSDYHIGIICALPLERTAVEAMLDETHDDLPSTPNDNNTYTFGKIGKHNVVVVSLGSGSYGTASASQVANDMRHTFAAVKWRLMVGIAGGCPNPKMKGGDVRLGDIVVGCVNGVPSVINYRLGKETTTGFDIRSELAEPPEALQRAVSALKSQHQREGPTYLMHLQAMLKNPRWNRPRIVEDYYNLPEAPDTLCKEDSDETLPREPRYLRDPPLGLQNTKFVKMTGDPPDQYAEYPAVHFGTIASADTLMKNAIQREAVYQQIKSQRKADVLCFEMEAAGIVKNWPCLVVRGICDYSDSHKNDAWQNFAAATAAAYAKDLLLRIQPSDVESALSASEVIDGGAERTQYVNSGSGTQRIYTQTGGTNSKQYNAENMTFGRDT